MIRHRIRQEYFDWLCDIVCDNRFPRDIRFTKLLNFLHHSEFIWMLPRDEDRALNGMSLRYRFRCEVYRHDEEIEYYLDGPCSILEMMVALSLDCEENIMSDPNIGDRTGQWFWYMITNLGLGSMTDSRFDERYVSDVILRFINRDYEPNGKGGLFTVRHCDHDLRDIEIWVQLCWYLNSII